MSVNAENIRLHNEVERLRTEVGTLRESLDAARQRDCDGGSGSKRKGEEGMSAKERTKYQIAVMQAYLDGEEIEFRDYNGEWTACLSPAWNWVNFEYRVKPTPRKWWCVIEPDSVSWMLRFESEDRARRYVENASGEFEIVPVMEIL